MMYKLFFIKKVIIIYENYELTLSGTGSTAPLSRQSKYLAVHRVMDKIVDINVNFKNIL